MLLSNSPIPETLEGSYFDSPPVLPMPKELPSLLDLVNPSQQMVFPSLPPNRVYPGMGQGAGYNIAPQTQAGVVENRLKGFASEPVSMETLSAPRYFDYERTQADRYLQAKNFSSLGFDPTAGTGNEYKYGARQTWGDVWSNGFSGMFKIAGNTFIEGWKGWGNLADAISSWDSSKLMGTNEELLEQDRITKEIMDKYAIFSTPESEQSVFNRKMFGDMLQQSGFALGTIGQFLSEELLTMGLASQFSLAKLGLKAPGFLGKVVTKAELALDAKRLGDPLVGSNTFSKLMVDGAKKLIPLANTGTDLYRYGKAGAGALQLASIGVGGVRRFLSEANMAMTEARMEAAGTYGELYNKLYDEELFATGQAPSNERMVQLEKAARDAASDNFTVNTGILLLSNRLQFDNLFSKFGPGRNILGVASEYADDVLKVSGKTIGGNAARTTTKLYEKGRLGTFGVLGAVAKDFGKKKAAWEATKSLGRNLFKWEASEGIQELLQEGSNRVMQDFYYDLYHGAKGADYLDYVPKAMEEQMSIQGMKTFLMGALTGRMLSPINFLVGKGKYYAGTSPEERVRRKEDLKRDVGLINSYYENPSLFLNEHIANVKLQDRAAKNMEEAILNRNQYEFHNNKDGSFAKLMSAAIKTDMFKALTDNIRKYGEWFNDQEFKEAFGFDRNEENIKSTKEYFNKIADETVAFQKTWKELKDRFSDRVMVDLYEKGTPERKIALTAKRALDEAIEILATNNYKAKRAAERAVVLQSEMASIPTIGSSVASAVRTMGVTANTSKEIELLESEIKTLESNENLDETAKKTIESKKQQVSMLKEWLDNHEAVVSQEEADKEKADKALAAFQSYLNEKNKESSIDVEIKLDEVGEVFGKLVDYIKLNKDHKDYIDSYNILANPIQFVQAHKRIYDAIDEARLRMLKEHLEEMRKAAGVDQEPGESVTISVKDKAGNVIEQQLTEGEEYLTEAAPQTRVYPKQNVKTTAYRQDVIKILKINEDGTISFIVNNNGETLTFTMEEFAENVGKLFPMKGMTPHQRIYFKNRDARFKINVRANSGKRHLIYGRHGSIDYSDKGVLVDARLELVREELIGDDPEPPMVFDEELNDWIYENKPKQREFAWKLKIVYTNPVTKAVEVIPYDHEYMKRYGSDKVNLLDITIDEQEFVNRNNEKRRVTQAEILNKALQEVISQAAEQQKARDEATATQDRLQKDLRDLVAEMELLEEFMAANKGKSSKKLTQLRKENRERMPVVKRLISETEAAIEANRTHLLNLQSQLDVLEQAAEFYSTGLETLQETGRPFSLNQEGVIYEDEQLQLQQLEEERVMRPGRMDDDTLFVAINDTQTEIDLINNRISELEDLLDRLNRLLGKVMAFDDIMGALENITDKEQLRNQLMLMENQIVGDLEETDNYKLLAKSQLLKALRKALAKGDLGIEFQYTYELIDQLKSALREFDSLASRLDVLEPKLERLEQEQDRRVRVSATQRRLDALKLVQERLVSEYKIRREKAGIKVEDKKVIVRPSETVDPLEDDLVKGSDSILVSQVVEDLVPEGELENETYTMVMGAMPVLNQTALFKSAGRHFKDLADTELNSPEDTRFFKFSETAALRATKKDGGGVVYYFVPVTRDSKEFQDIRVTSLPDGKTFEDDIRMVVMRKDSAGVLRPVDVNGNILETPTKDNMVYTAMLGSDELLSGDKEKMVGWVLGNFINKENQYSAEEIFQIAKNFVAFREEVKKRVASGQQVALPIEDKSPGVFNREPKGYTETGKLMPQQLPLNGRLIEDNPDFRNLKHPDGSSVRLTVSTVKGRVRPGRLLMVKSDDPNTAVVVYNRKFTDEEHARIIDILKRMSELFDAKISPEGLTEEQDREFQLGLRYLNGLVHWFKPKEGFEPYGFQMWVSNGLHIGKTTIDFTVESIERNKRLILDAIPYHKVNNGMLSDKQSGTSFTEVEVVDNKIVAGKSHFNYQEYLLTDREGGPVVYTNIKPYTPPSNASQPQDFQLKNVYLRYGFNHVLELPALESEKMDTERQEEGTSGDTGSKPLKRYSVNVITEFFGPKNNEKKMFSVVNGVPKGKLTFVRMLKDGVTELYIHVDHDGTKYKVVKVIDQNGLERNHLAEPNEELINDAFESIFDQQAFKAFDDVEAKQKIEENIKIFNQTFISIEDYTGKGETPTVASVDHKIEKQEESAPPVIKPQPAADPKYDAFVQERYKIYSEDEKFSGRTPIPIDEFENLFEKTLRKEYEIKKPMSSTMAGVIKGSIEKQGTSIEIVIVGDTNKEFLLTIDNKDGNIRLYSDKQPTGLFTAGDYASKEDVEKLYKKYVPQSTRNAIDTWVGSHVGAWAASGTPENQKLLEAERNLLKEFESLEGGKSASGSGVLQPNVSPIAVATGTARTSPVETAVTNPVDDDNDVPWFDPNARMANTLSPTEVKENVKAFKEWMKKFLPMFDVEIFDQLIDGKYIGQFYNGMIRLYENAEYGTGFHEAFEAVWNALLTPAQKKELLDEYRRRENYASNKHFVWARQNYKMLDENGWIKEALAEEFREYMLSNAANVEKGAPKRNTFFRRLWNFIRKLFGLSESSRADMTDKINSLFADIAGGRFKDAKVIPSFDPDIKHNKAIQGTTVEFTQQLLEGMSAIFFIKLYTDGHNVDELFERKNNLFEKIYKDTVKIVSDTFRPEYVALIKSEVFQNAGEGERQLLIDAYNEQQRRIQGAAVYDQKLIAVRQFNGEVKENFKLMLSQFGLQFDKRSADRNEQANADDETVEDMIFEKEETSNTLGIQDVMYVDPETLTNPAVRLLIMSLTDDVLDKDGRITSMQKNPLGLFSLVPYKKKMNVLLNELSNIVPVHRKQPDGTYKHMGALELMHEKLIAKYTNPSNRNQFKEGYTWINRLFKRLGYHKLQSGEPLNESEMRLLLAFENAFNKNKNVPLKLMVGLDGRLRHVNAINVSVKQKIKEEWRNSVLDKVPKSDMKDPAKGPILVINDAGFIELNLKSETFKKSMTSATNINEIMVVLSKLGIKLTKPVAQLSSEEVANIQDSFRRMRAVLADYEKKNERFFYSQLFDRKDVVGPLNRLLDIEAEYKGEEDSLSHLTPENKTQYAISLPSQTSNIINSLNLVGSLAEFVMTNPQYGVVTPNGDVILNPYNTNSELLKPGGLLFDLKGDRRRNAAGDFSTVLEYVLIQGMASDQVADASNTDKLVFNDKIVQEMYHILMNGVYFTVINSDKSSEFGIKMGHFVSPDKITDNGFIVEKYLNALRDEVMHALYFHFNPNNIKEHQDNILQLGHFQEILGFTDDDGKPKSDVQKMFLQAIKDAKITSRTPKETQEKYFKLITENVVSTVKNNRLIEKYIDSQVTDHKKWLVDDMIVKKNEATNRYESLAVPEDNPVLGNDVKSMSETEYTKLVKFILVNRQLSIYEQHKMFLGHPALYKDLPKRSSGMNSQKKSVSENPMVIEWMNQTKPRYDGKTRNANRPVVQVSTLEDPAVVSSNLDSIAKVLYLGYMSVVKDHKRVCDLLGADFVKDTGEVKKYRITKQSILKGYSDMTESDGMAYLMPDYFRDLNYLSSLLDEEQEQLLDYENALEVVERSEADPGDPIYKVYPDNVVAEARELLKNPRPIAVIQMLKPQGFGPSLTEKMVHNHMLKNSVFTLTWSRVRNNPTMLKTYIAAQKRGDDIIDFSSAHKLGVVENSNGEVTPLYDNNGMPNSEAPTTIQMPMKYVGIQVETPSLAKNAVIFGSQIKKIILSNLPKSLMKQREEYIAIIDQLLEIETDALMDELGVRLEDGVYKTYDLDKMVQTLKSQAIRRGLPNNIIDMLEVVQFDMEQQLRYPLDANPARERIEYVITSLVDNRIVRMEMFGKASVQVANTMWEQGKRDMVFLNSKGLYEKVDDYGKLNKEQKKSVRLTSNNLNFYNEDRGYMEVYIPWYFEGVSPEEMGFVKNSAGVWVPKEGAVDPRLLKAIGFRIPTQAFNMADSIRIAGFLDPSYGDMVVVPSEIVGKSGSDFDIDKLNLFLFNYRISVKGLEPIEYSTSADEVERRFIDVVRERESDDVKKLMLNLSFEERKGLRSEYKKKIGGVIDALDENLGAEFRKMSEEREKYEFQASKSLEDAETYFKGLFQYGRTVFRQLGEETLEHFDRVKKHIQLQKIKGPREIELYMENAIKLRESGLYERDNKVLDSLIEIYQQELVALGFKENQLIPYVKKYQEYFKKKKQLLLQQYSENKRLQLSNLYEERDEEMHSIHLEMAIQSAKLMGMPTLEEFGKLPIEKQNTKKSLQNRLMEVMREIIEHPENRRQLLTPNTARTLKLLSEYIIGLKGGKKSYVERNMTKLSEWKTMAVTRETFVTSKQLVGVGALQITSHAMSQVGELEMTGSYVDRSGKVKKVNIKLTHNKSNKFDLVVDADDYYIFDMLSESLTGSVDASKDPFIYELKLTLETAATWFYLGKKGVPQQEISLFFNQPVADRFFNLKDGNGTIVNRTNDTNLPYDELIIETLKPYYEIAFGKPLELPENYYAANIVESLKKIAGQWDNYPVKDLEDNIRANKLTPQQARMQMSILFDMLDYLEQGRMVSNYIKSIAYDTTRTKTVTEYKMQAHRAKRPFIDKFFTEESMNRVFEKTFLQRIKNEKENMLRVFSNFLIGLHPSVMPVFDPILNQIDDTSIMMSDSDKVDMLKRYQAYVIAYILQNTPYGRENAIKESFSLMRDQDGQKSLPKVLKSVKSRYKNNPALDALFPIISDNTEATDNIKLFNNSLNSYDIDVLSEALENLMDLSEREKNDEELQYLVKNLTKFTILQSGIQGSPITFSKVLPIRMFSSVASQILRSFVKSDMQIDTAQVWKTFHQNYYTFKNVVPKVKYQKGKIENGLYRMKSTSSMAGYDFIKMYKIKEGVSKEMIKSGLLKFNELFETLLFEKIKIFNKEGIDITNTLPVIKYRPINKLGNGMYMLETSPADLLTGASRLKTNNPIDESMYDEAVDTHVRVNEEFLRTGNATPLFNELPSADPTISRRVYAGVGSRGQDRGDGRKDIPEDMKARLTAAIQKINKLDYVARTGDADGSDAVVRNKGLLNKVEVFEAKDADERTRSIAREIHPNPDALAKPRVLDLMARNTFQIFGQDLDSPVDFVLVYEPSGYDGSGLRPERGGSNQAIDMAYRKDIPIINVALDNWEQKLDEVLTEMASRPISRPARKKDKKKEVKSTKASTATTVQNNAAATQSVESVATTSEQTPKDGAAMLEAIVNTAVSAAIKTYREMSGGTMTPSAQPAANVLGEIKMKIIEDWVKQGTATSTVRSEDYHKDFYKGDGVYRSENGVLTKVTYRGTVQYKDNRVFGSQINIGKEEFAKREGFGTWSNFVTNSKWAGKKLLKGESVHFYELEYVGMQPVQPTAKPAAQTSMSSLPKPNRNKTIKLKDGKTYATSMVKSNLLEKIGYTPEEIGEILKNIC